MPRSRRGRSRWITILVLCTLAASLLAGAVLLVTPTHADPLFPSAGGRRTAALLE